jgi:hypothetical protein
MLCYAMLCYAMLCYAMLCYAMLCAMPMPESSKKRPDLTSHSRADAMVCSAVRYESELKEEAGHHLEVEERAVVRDAHLAYRSIEMHSCAML